MERDLMKRIPITIVGLSLIALMLITPVAAQTNHNLQWGVETGETFTYALQRKVVDSSQAGAFTAVLPFLSQLEEGSKVIANVTRLGTIPEEFSSIVDVPIGLCTLTRENDSTTIWTNFTLLFIPVGDWDLLSGAYNESIIGITIVNTPEKWGVKVSTSFPSEGQTIDYYQELLYEKDNGTMSSLRIMYSTLGNVIMDVFFVHWYPGMPTVLAPEIQFTTILTVALGSTLFVIVAILIYKFMKSQKSLAQRLGE